MEKYIAEISYMLGQKGVWFKSEMDHIGQLDYEQMYSFYHMIYRYTEGLNTGSLLQDIYYILEDNNKILYLYRKFLDNDPLLE